MLLFFLPKAFKRIVAYIVMSCFEDIETSTRGSTAMLFEENECMASRINGDFSVRFCCFDLKTSKITYFTTEYLSIKFLFKYTLGE